MYSPSLIVYCTSFPAKPTNSLYSCTKPLHSGYISAINMMCRICVSKISRMLLHHYVLFQPTELFIRGNSRNLFPKCWNWQICHTHQAFKLSLCTFSGKLQTFPTVKNQFLLDGTQLHFSLEKFHLSYFRKTSC